MRGDELAGAWLGRRLERSPELATRPSFGRAEVVWGNPKAYEAMRGFVDEDLSTQFSADRLEDLTLSAYEASRAKELNRELGPKGSATAVGFIVELRAATNDLGVVFVVEAWSAVGLAAASWCHRILSPLVERGELPAVRVVLRFGGGKRSSRHVTSLARHGLSIVAGPEPRGALREDLCRSMEVATSAVLDFLDILADGSLDLPASTTVYRDIGQFSPTSSDARAGLVVHEQMRDFLPLFVGDPAFRQQSGETVPYDGSLGRVVWPFRVQPNAGSFSVACVDEVSVAALMSSASQPASLDGECDDLKL